MLAHHPTVIAPATTTTITMIITMIDDDQDVSNFDELQH
jgi:hypothetical protein